MTEAADNSLLTAAALDALAASICILDSTGRIVYVNAAWLRFARERSPANAADFLGCDYFAVCDRVNDADAEYARPLAAALREMADGRRTQYAIEYPCRTPQWARWFRASAIALPGEGQRRILIVHEEITDQKLQQDRLERSEHLYRRLVEEQNDFMILSAPDTTIEFANAPLRRALGQTSEEISGKRWIDFVPSEDLQRIHEQIAALTPENPVFEWENRDRRADGEWGWTHWNNQGVFDAAGRLVKLHSTGRDITARKEAEERIRILDAQLARNQRLESLGTLAAGIAHDFNNLLTGIFGNVQLALRNPGSGAEFLERALETLERGRALANQLLVFARGGEPRREALALPALIQRTVEFALADGSVRAEFSFSPDLRPCYVDRHQIEQVFENLALNALQAMPKGGRIRVHAENVQSAETIPAALAARPADQYVRIVFADNGPGVSPEIAASIFDPFFSRRAGGAGLGLAIAYGTLKRHGGAIELDQTGEPGATFSIYLPAALETMPERRNEERTPAHFRGRGTILVLEDEATLLQVMRTHLESLGYEAATARTGPEALQAFRDSRHAGRALAAGFLDLTVAGAMGGRETAARLRAEDAALPLFVMSGYSDESALARPGEFHFTDSLPKPYTLEQLVALLQKHRIGI